MSDLKMCAKGLYSCKKKKELIYDVKKLLNCILENGAYSVSNENRQMVEKSDNYNGFEKVLVQVSWRFRSFVGRKMQGELLDIFRGDKDFLDELKHNDPELFSLLMRFDKDGTLDSS